MKFFGREKVFSKPEDSNASSDDLKQDPVIEARRNFLKVLGGAGVAVASGGAPQAATVLAQTLAAAGSPLSQKAVEKLPQVARLDMSGLRKLIGKFTSTFKTKDWDSRAAEVERVLTEGVLPIREGVFDTEIVKRMGESWGHVFENLPAEWRLGDIVDSSLAEGYKAIVGEDLPQSIANNLDEAVERIQRITGGNADSTFGELRKSYEKKVAEVFENALKPENKGLWGKEAIQRRQFLDEIRERVPRGSEHKEVFDQALKEMQGADAEWSAEYENKRSSEIQEKTEKSQENFESRKDNPVYFTLKEYKGIADKNVEYGTIVFDLKIAEDYGDDLRELMDVDIYQMLQAHMPEVAPGMVAIEYVENGARLRTKDARVIALLRNLIKSSEAGEDSLVFPDRVTGNPLRKL
jgi:hypothetical protein